MKVFIPPFHGRYEFLNGHSWLLTTFREPVKFNFVTCCQFCHSPTKTFILVCAIQRLPQLPQISSPPPPLTPNPIYSPYAHTLQCPALSHQLKISYMLKTKLLQWCSWYRRSYFISFYLQRILKEQIADQFKVAFGFCKEHWKYKFLLYPLYCSNLSHLIGSLLCRGRCTMREDLVFNFQQTGFFILCGSYIQLKGPKKFLSIPGPIVCLFVCLLKWMNRQTRKHKNVLRSVPA